MAQNNNGTTSSKSKLYLILQIHANKIPSMRLLVTVHPAIPKTWWEGHKLVSHVGIVQIRGFSESCKRQASETAELRLELSSS